MVQGFGFVIVYDPAGRIYVRLDPYYINRVRGLCGNNDGNPQDFYARNGLVGPKVDFIESYEHPDCPAGGITEDDANPCDMSIGVGAFKQDYNLCN